MVLVLIGVLLVALKLGDIGPFAGLSWWWVLAPFGGAVVWWAFADSTGWTQRRAMERLDERKAKRRERDMEALGLDTRRARRAEAVIAKHRRGQSPDERQARAPDVNEDGRRKEP
jgi:small Trp-rich protein